MRTIARKMFSLTEESSVSKTYQLVSFILMIYNCFVFLFFSRYFNPISITPSLRNYMGGHLYITADYPRSKQRIQNITKVLRYFDESGMLPVALSDIYTWDGFNMIYSKQSDMDKYMKIAPIKTKRKKLEVAMWLRRNNSLSHFLYNTTAAWALLFDDDCDFAPHNYFRMIDDLDRKYKTESEPIIFGQKLSYTNLKTGSLVGGAGFIVSRKFAEIFLNTFEYEMENMYHPDDIHMTQLAEKYGNVPSCYYGKYATTNLFPRELKILVEHKYNQFPKCTSVDNIVPEYYDVYPKLKDMFSFHKLQELQGARWEYITKEMPDNLIVYRGWKYFCTHICRDYKSSAKNISQKIRGKDTKYRWEDNYKKD